MFVSAVTYNSWKYILYFWGPKPPCLTSASLVQQDNLCEEGKWESDIGGITKNNILEMGNVNYHNIYHSVTIFIYKKLILFFIKYLKKITLKLYAQLHNSSASFWFCWYLFILFI